MNELTRNIKKIMVPKAALVAYEEENEEWHERKSYYLELRPIDGNGRMRAAIPVTYEFINSLLESFSVEIAEMPHGRVPGNLLRCDTRKGNEKYVWYNPPARRRMFFHEELNIENGDFNMPGIIYKVQSDRLDVFAFKGDMPDEKCELYFAPYFNVTGSAVCLGSSKLERPQNPSFTVWLAYWENLFWMSEFSHLGTNGNPTRNNLVLVTESARNRPFDYSELIPMNKKLKDLLV